MGCGFIPVWLTQAAYFRQASGVGLMAFLLEGVSRKRGDDRWMGPATALGTEAVGVGGNGGLYGHGECSLCNKVLG